MDLRLFFAFQKLKHYWEDARLAEFKAIYAVDPFPRRMSYNELSVEEDREQPDGVITYAFGEYGFFVK